MIRALPSLLILLSAGSANAESSFSIQVGRNVADAVETGDYSQYRVGANPDGTVIDARGKTWYARSSTNPDPDGYCDYAGGDALPVAINRISVRNGDTSGGHWIGGKIVGDQSLTVDYYYIHSPPFGTTYCNSAGMLWDPYPIENGVTIEGLRIDRVWDGIKLGSGSCLENPGTCHYIINDVWISNVRDDCIEADNMPSVTVTDSLFDGCFSGISSQIGNTIMHEGVDKITLEGVLLRLKGFPYSVDFGAGLVLTQHHIGPFKINDTYGPDLVVNNTIIAFEYYDDDRATAWGAFGWDKITSCSNNYLLWMSDETYPPGSNFPKVPACFTVQTGPRARATWVAAKAAWIARHDDVIRVSGDPVFATIHKFGDGDPLRP